MATLSNSSSAAKGSRAISLPIGFIYHGVGRGYKKDGIAALLAKDYA